MKVDEQLMKKSLDAALDLSVWKKEGFEKKKKREISSWKEEKSSIMNISGKKRSIVFQKLRAFALTMAGKSALCERNQ